MSGQQHAPAELYSAKSTYILLSIIITIIITVIIIIIIIITGSSLFYSSSIHPSIPASISLSTYCLSMLPSIHPSVSTYTLLSIIIIITDIIIIIVTGSPIS